MENTGVDMSGYYQKLLTNIPESVDTLITMAFNVIYIFVPSQHSEDSKLVDPSGRTVEVMATPGILIDEKFLSSGTIPSKRELKKCTLDLYP